MLAPFHKEQDYPVLCEWLSKMGKAVPAYEILPDTGYVCYEEHKLLAMCLYYQTNSKLVFAEFLTVNPDIHGEERSKAIDEVMIGGAVDLKNKGFLMFCRTSDARVKFRLEKNGFRHIQSGLDLYCF